MTARRVLELASTGIDEFLGIIGSDPFGSTSWVGLRVPTLATATIATANGTNIPAARYLFAAANFSVGEGAMARIIGYRQLVTIGTTQTEGGTGQKRAIEQLVSSPFWHFPDGDVSFHIRSVRGVPLRTPGPTDRRSFKFRRSDGPALLYETATVPAGGLYVNLTAYRPPNAGRPWGEPLEAHQGVFYDQRTQWLTHGAWNALDLEVEGPDIVTAFVSVCQTNPSGRPVITPPTPFFPGGLSAEEQFLLNFPSAIYWRVGMSLIVEVGRRVVEVSGVREVTVGTDL